MTNTLFDPVQLGAVKAKNRLAMAPLTRLRAEMDGTPNGLLVQHYKDRASLGLIIAEGTFPVLEGRSWYGQPGIETQAHEDGWKKVTDAVHAEGGVIALQIMHGGRVSHTELTGGRLVGPSAIAAPGEVRVADGKAPYPVPHALETEEIPGIIEGFVHAARRAMNAGFDAVEIHGANGYLISEFFAQTSNTRTDEYGGTPENHARLAIDITRAVAEAIGADRTAIRLSPQHNVQGAEEPDDEFTRATYRAYAEAVAPLRLAYIHVLHADPEGELVQDIRTAAGAPFILNTGFGHHSTREEAAHLVEGGFADAVAVGRPAIANPDLVRRWREDLPENFSDSSTFYTRGSEGYNDYPFYEG